MASAYGGLGKSFPASWILGFWDPGNVSQELLSPRMGPGDTGWAQTLHPNPGICPFPRDPVATPWNSWSSPEHPPKGSMEASPAPPFPAPLFPAPFFLLPFPVPFPCSPFPCSPSMPGHPCEIQALPVQSQSHIPKAWEQNWSFHSPSPPALNVPGRFPGPGFIGKNSSVEKGDGKRWEFADSG